MFVDDITAVILAAGRGSRMGELCDDLPKCLVEIDGVPLLKRQVDALRRMGIRNVVIVLGYCGDLVFDTVKSWHYSDMIFAFPRNDDWQNTNYGTSLDEAFPYVSGRGLLLHGDLVFSDDVLRGLLDHSPYNSYVVGSRTVPYSGKDFLARLDDSGRVVEIGVGLDGTGCVPSQPMYLLSRKFVFAWEMSLRRAMSVPENRLRYAEDFLPVDESLYLYDSGDALVCEVDCKEDMDDVLSHVIFSDLLRTSVKFMPTFESEDISFAGDKALVITKRAVDTGLLSKMLSADVVLSSSFPRLPTQADCECLLDSCMFADCDGIVGIGAGSAIDTAKVLRIGLEGRRHSEVPFVAMPTLPGSGAEITPFASLWDGGAKFSVYEDRFVPDQIVYVDDFSKSTNANIRYFGVLDMCCHAIESSISRGGSCSSLARSVLRLISDKSDEYIHDAAFWREFHMGSLAGGVCIAQNHTCIGHAMGYGLTFKLGIPHGLASAACLYEVLLETGVESGLMRILHKLLASYDADFHCKLRYCNARVLAKGVNVERMSNFPVPLSEDDLVMLYDRVLHRLCFI